MEVGTAGGLPIIAPQFAPMAMQQQASQPSPQPSAGQQMSQPSQQRGSAARAAKPRPKRPYKPPHQVAQERKLKDEANVSRWAGHDAGQLTAGHAAACNSAGMRAGAAAAAIHGYAVWCAASQQSPSPPSPPPSPLGLPCACCCLPSPLQDYIRRLEQQLGKARSELERLQRDNTTLQRKAVVLSKHSSFRRCAAGMVQELQEVGAAAGAAAARRPAGLHLAARHEPAHPCTLQPAVGCLWGGDAAPAGGWAALSPQLGAPAHALPLHLLTTCLPALPPLPPAEHDARRAASVDGLQPACVGCCGEGPAGAAGARVPAQDDQLRCGTALQQRGGAGARPAAAAGPGARPGGCAAAAGGHLCAEGEGGERGGWLAALPACLPCRAGCLRCCACMACCGPGAALWRAVLRGGAHLPTFSLDVQSTCCMLHLLSRRALLGTCKSSTRRCMRS